MNTKSEYTQYFKSEILPLVKHDYEQDGRIDHPARREAWNDCVDADVKDGLLPTRALDWACPW